VQVLPLFEKKKTRLENGMRLGRRMDDRSLYRMDGKLFQRRSLPDENQDVAIGVLIDMSGSMGGERIQYAKIAALCLYQFAIDAGIPICVYGHHTRMSSTYLEVVRLESLAEFDSVDGKDAYRISSMSAGGNNRDGLAIRYMGEMLLTRLEKEKMMVLISDGLPSAIGYGGPEAVEDLKKAKCELEKKGITFLAAAIGGDKMRIQSIYEDAFLDITDIRKLPEKLTKHILRKIA